MPVPTYQSEQLVKYYFTAESVAARPTAWSLRLHTGDPGLAGSANLVTTGTDANYAEQAATFTAANNSGVWEARNNATIAFPAAAVGASYTVTHVSLVDGGGNVRGMAQLAVPQPVVAGTVISFAINDLVFAGASA